MWYLSNISRFSAALLVSTSGLALSAANAQEVSFDGSQATTAVAAELSLASQALHDQLQLLDRPRLATWYAANDYAPIWDAAGIDTLTAVLQAAPSNGLPAIRYDVAQLRALQAAANSSPDSAAMFEATASDIYLRYAIDVSTGLINPSSLSRLIDRRRQVANVADLMDGVRAEGANPAFYAALEPQAPVYRALKNELVRLAAVIAEGETQPRVGPGRSLRPGQTDERVLALRVRLAMQGYTDVAGDSPVYDTLLADAVKAFQTINNLDADGIIGPKTLEAINADPTQHYQQVLVNLERARWMNFDRGARHIWVNQASYMGYVIDNGSVSLETRVVVGKSGEKYQTVEFSDVMEHMVINPSWNVPESIASQEYLPDILRDPTLLARQNIEMQVRGSGRIVDPRLVNLSQYTVNNFPYVLRQRPGSGNALGRVKFMFPNRHNIYLHDTPSRSLFNRDTRAFSHGCVRVQRPLELAYLLLAPQESDPEGMFTAVLNTRQETQINLTVHVPVHLVYNTVFLNDLGELEYRIDVYGRDPLVFDALADVGVTMPTIQG